MRHLPQVVVAASWEDDLQDGWRRKGRFNNHTNKE